ncbi:MAG: hypothetical protein AAF821_12140 [Cyanobacteria bacterium P01_D01_bin.156]
MNKRIKADKVSVLFAIVTLTLIATVAMASPLFFPHVPLGAVVNFLG